MVANIETLRYARYASRASCLKLEQVGERIIDGLQGSCNKGCYQPWLFNAFCGRDQRII